MEQPLVSVVLCCFNGAKFLATQIDSILGQSFPSIELIIADDASTDETRQVLQLYEDHPAVRIFYQEKNRGLTANFAFAAQQAGGQWIAFADQDDIWLPHKIETLVKNIGHSPLIYSDSLLMDEQGNSMHKKLSDLKKMYSGTDSRGYFLYSCVWGHGMLITRELLQHSLPMPSRVHHDIWIVYQAFLHGGIHYHDEVLTHYRQHPNSTSQTLPEKDSTRKKENRYEAYKNKLYWLSLMQQHERPEYQDFYKRLLALYSQKEKSAYVFGVILFMLRHRTAIFRYSKKRFLSQFIEILKQARGEKP